MTSEPYEEKKINCYKFWCVVKQNMMATASDMLSTIAVIAAIILLVKSILLLQQRWKFQQALKSFPEHPRGIPFLGHAKAFLDGARGQLSDFDDIYDNNEKAMQVWMTPFKPGVVVYHPDSIRAVFKTAEPKFQEYQFFIPWLGDGLVISTGKKWSRNRRLLTPAFHFDILKPYVKVFVESTNKLANKWKAECADSACSIEVMQDISLATLDSLMRCVMGVEDDFQRMGRKHPYVHATYFLTEQVLMRFGSLLYRSDTIYALSPNGRAFRKAAKTAHDFSEKAIRERRQRLEHSNYDSSKERLRPFLDILLQAKDEDGVGLSDIEIRNQVDTFMFGGHDTTSSGLSWIVYNLANHPEFQERCRNEVDEVMEGKADNDS
ncbi:cytochrome P450 4F4-like [Amphiura filiformis]|uniref:cytochrome P450 4F4-like n=1 Tax=Amphiura filiformis TaxID=82378 RepID=UPI003B2288D1